MIGLPTWDILQRCSLSSIKMASWSNIYDIDVDYTHFMIGDHSTTFSAIIANHQIIANIIRVINTSYQQDVTSISLAGHWRVPQVSDWSSFAYSMSRLLWLDVEKFSNHKFVVSKDEHSGILFTQRGSVYGDALVANYGDSLVTSVILLLKKCNCILRGGQ